MRTMSGHKRHKTHKQHVDEQPSYSASQAAYKPLAAIVVLCGLAVVVRRGPLLESPRGSSFASADELASRAVYEPVGRTPPGSDQNPDPWDQSGQAAAMAAGTGDAAAADSLLGQNTASFNPSRHETLASVAHQALPALKTLSFEVCDGFSQQRLAIAHGLLIAKLLGRTPVQPALLLYGTSIGAFDSTYDGGALLKAVGPLGVPALVSHVQQLARARSGATSLQLGFPKEPIRDVVRYFEPYAATDHLSLDCPLFKLAPGVVKEHRGLLWTVLKALQPAPAMSAVVGKALDRIGPGPFNFLHLRLDRDWRAYCERCVCGGQGAPWPGLGGSTFMGLEFMCGASKFAADGARGAAASARDECCGGEGAG